MLLENVLNSRVTNNVQTTEGRVITMYVTCTLQRRIFLDRARIKQKFNAHVRYLVNVHVDC